jgi:hypothetical protein
MTGWGSQVSLLRSAAAEALGHPATTITHPETGITPSEKGDLV